MRKVEFIKTAVGICIYLNDFLFKNDSERIEKITEVLKLFPFNNMLLKSSFFIDEDETFLSELKDLIECEVKTEFTKTKLFSKKKYSKIQISFKGEHIADAIDFIVKKDLSLGIDCYNADNILALQFVVNDNDGACITFNTKIFNAEEIKPKIKEILNLKNY